MVAIFLQKTLCLQFNSAIAVAIAVENSIVCHHGDLPNDLSVISHHTSPFCSLTNLHNSSVSHKAGINKRFVEINDRWWIKLLIKELDSAEIINAIGVVIHVGKYTTFTTQEATETMYQSIKYIINYLKNNNYHE